MIKLYISKSVWFQAENVWAFILEGIAVHAFCLWLIHMIHTEQYVARDWYATPVWGEWIDLIYCGTPLRYFWCWLSFLECSRCRTGHWREQKKWKRRGDKEGVISQWDWLLMCWYMRECWGALTPRSDARLSTLLDFKKGLLQSGILLKFHHWRRQKKVKQWCLLSEAAHKKADLTTLTL